MPVFARIRRVASLGRRLALAAALAGPGAARAAPGVLVEADSLEGEGWRVERPQVSLQPAEQGLALTVMLPAVRLGAGDSAPVGEIELHCGRLTVNDAYLVCDSGSGSFLPAGSPAPVETGFSLVYRRGDGAWRGEGRLRAGTGTLDWSVSDAGGGLSARLNADDVAVATLAELLPAAVPGWLRAPAGTLTELSLELDLPARGMPSAQFRLQARGLGFDSPDGRYAAAGTDARVAGSARWSESSWELEATGAFRGGEFLAGPLYSRIGDEPVTVNARVAGDGNFIRVEALEYSDPGALAFTASARIPREGEGTASLSVRDFSARFPAFFQRYLQSVLAQYGFGGLVTSGGIEGGMDASLEGLRSLTLDFEQLDVSDAAGRLEFSDLDGQVRWSASGERQRSRVTWQSARLYRLALGSVDLRAEAGGDSFRLAGRTEIPVLDGALVINEFRVTDWLSPAAELLFDARLLPVSLASLSEALQWPALSGNLSGRIPGLTFEDGVYSLDGMLEVEAFDGALQVSNLKLERPFGVLPKLVADVELRDLDLERLTRTFSFGRIQGRLEGYVRELRLLDWQPVHFVAAFGTPPDDPSRHRISQRAVDTLTSIGGGGAGGALSRSFLRFFEEFGYRRLGIQCRLENNICRMAGVAPAPAGGYYIVEGSGIPRVDVIGHVREVDWPRLMRQLIQATQGRGPVVGGSQETDGN